MLCVHVMIIIIDGNLRLCDKDGDFTTGAGYKVTKIK